MYIVMNNGVRTSSPEGSTVWPNNLEIDYIQLYRTDAPSVPAGLTGSPGNALVNLSWKGSSGATSYNVKRSTSPGGPHATIFTTGAATNYTDTAVVNGTTYYYVISAVSALGESANSPENNFTPLAASLSQGKPASASSVEAGNDPFDANDGNFSTRWTASNGTYPQWWQVDLGSSQSLDKVAIYWFDSANRSYRYRIEVSSDGLNYATVADRTSSGQTGNTADNFLALARYIRVTVTGVTPSGGWAAFYECHVLGTAGSSSPAAPSGLSATAASSSQIDLAWADNAANEDGFLIERSTDGTTFTQIAAVGVNVTTYSDAGLAAGATYHYRVRAYNGTGNSAYSNIATATTPPAGGIPSAPSNLTATSPTKKKIHLSWSDTANNESGYKIERSTDGVNYSQITTVSANIVTYSNSGLTSGTTYHYRVRAYNANGDSPYSNTASAVAK
jgi:fibronectin type 3 domain-containing protein